MTLFSGKLMFLAVAFVLLAGFGTGHIHMNNDKVECFEKKRWTSTRWHTFYAFGKVELRYRNANYDCPNTAKFDPKDVVPLNGNYDKLN